MAGGPGVGSGTSASAHNHAATRATLTSAEVTGSTGMTRSVGGDMGVTAAVQSESDSSGRLPGLAECCLGGRSGSCRSGPQCPRPPQTPCEDKGAPQGWEGWEVQFGGRLLAHGGMAGHLLLPGRTRPTPPRCPPSAPRGTGRDGVGRRALARPLTWSAPGWSPGSPRERCWPSGPSAGAPPACSGTRAGIRPWLRCATGTASSSSSRGGFWKESALSQGRRRPRGRASGGATSAAHAPSPGRPGPRTRAKRPRAVVQRAHVRASPP